MRDLVKRFFSKIAADASPRTTQDGGHDARVATCALFLEMAKIDETFSREEMAKILTILEETYGLSAADADELVAAAEQELAGSIDNWHFARLINDNYSTAEKIDIIEMLWRIVYVDGKLDKFENQLMHQLSNILRLSHEQLIEAKVRVLYEDDNP
ncbi:MAG: TerB family tellurite resistance protein [Desulfobacterales bacterium]